MIQLDSLQEIAQRGKASSTKLIYQQIMDRKKKAEELVDFEDLRKKHAGVDRRKLERQHTFNMQEKQKHQEFMQKFQSNGKKEEDAQDIGDAYNFHRTLRSRLNDAFLD